MIYDCSNKVISIQKKKNKIPKNKFNQGGEKHVHWKL